MALFTSLQPSTLKVEKGDGETTISPALTGFAPGSVFFITIAALRDVLTINERFAIDMIIIDLAKGIGIEDCLDLAPFSVFRLGPQF